MAESSEFDGLFAVIDAKISALVRLRESLVAAAQTGALGNVGDIDLGPVPPPAGGGLVSTPSASGPVDIPTGAFRTMGLADSIRMFFRMVKRKQTQREIKEALVEGGLATTSTYFDATLSATLHRLKKSGELLQFKDGWDLAESYPSSFRQRHAEVSSDDAPRKRKKKAKKAATTSKVRTAAPKKGENKPDAPNLRAVGE